MDKKFCEDKKESLQSYHFYDSLTIMNKEEFENFVLMKEVIE